MHGGRQVNAACFRATRNKNEAYENMPVVRCKPHSCSFPLFFCSLVCTVSVNNNDTDFIFQPDVLIRLEGNRIVSASTRNFSNFSNPLDFAENA